MTFSLRDYLKPAEGSDVSFEGRYPEEFLVRPRLEKIPAWHLVGGKDPVDPEELTGSEPNDGYPVLLRDWIRRDGLKCLKVKLRGDDAEWDYDRLIKVGRMAVEENVDWLTADFNCTVREVGYVNTILDRLIKEYPRLYGMLLYVEQPFPYDLKAHRIDVHSVSARKPLFMDESAHDWRYVRLGRELGWSGVALKTCKTQTGAILSLCWAKAHGMTLMVQDLSNPMLAQIPHVLWRPMQARSWGWSRTGCSFTRRRRYRRPECILGCFDAQEECLISRQLAGRVSGIGLVRSSASCRWRRLRMRFEQAGWRCGRADLGCTGGDLTFGFDGKLNTRVEQAGSKVTKAEE